MKIRNSFVSNSSSSSFVIVDKAKQEEAKEILKNVYCGDYYIFKDIMYTSFINDGNEQAYSALSKLSSDDISGGDIPYDPEEFVEVEGVIGVNSVWLDKQMLSDKDLISLGEVPIGRAERLYRYVKSGINSSDKKLFYETCIKIVEGDFEDED